MHQRMGNLEVGGIDGQIVEEQDIDVNGTVPIALAFVVTSEFTLYLLSDLEHLPGQECCLTVDGAVEELVA